MPQACTVCTSPQRAAIDAALASGAPNRRIAAQFFVTEQAVRRHKADHLPASLVEAAQAQQASDAIDVMQELVRCLRRVNLLFDACDRWLRDPEAPEQYDIGPRSTDVNVIYTVTGTDGKAQRKKAALSELLARLSDEPYVLERWEYKHADPRELVLKTAAQLGASMELLAKLEGKLQQEGTTNIVINQQVSTYTAILMQALGPWPDARAAAAAALEAHDVG